MNFTEDSRSTQAHSFFDRIGDAKANGGFASVPNRVVRDNTLSLPARMLYTILCSHWGGDKNRYAISREELAREMGMSVRQVSDYIFELEKAELIVRKRPPKKGFTNTYWAVPIASRYGENVDRNSTACGEPPITNKNSSITTLEEPNSFGVSSAVEESSPSTPFPNGQSKEEHAVDRRSASYHSRGEPDTRDWEAIKRKRREWDEAHARPAYTLEELHQRVLGVSTEYGLGWSPGETAVVLRVALRNVNPADKVADAIESLRRSTTAARNNGPQFFFELVSSGSDALHQKLLSDFAREWAAA
jgi:hypothetical protein